MQQRQLRTGLILIAIGLVGIIFYVKDVGLKEEITCLT